MTLPILASSVVRQMQVEQQMLVEALNTVLGEAYRIEVTPAVDGYQIALLRRGDEAGHTHADISHTQASPREERPVPGEPQHDVVQIEAAAHPAETEIHGKGAEEPGSGGAGSDIVPLAPIDISEDMRPSADHAEPTPPLPPSAQSQPHGEGGEAETQDAAPVVATVSAGPAKLTGRAELELPLPSSESSLLVPSIGRRENAYLANNTDPSERARRLAHTLISDILAYHPGEEVRSLGLDEMRLRFADQIEAARGEFFREAAGLDDATLESIFEGVLIAIFRTFATQGA